MLLSAALSRSFLITVGSAFVKPHRPPSFSTRLFSSINGINLQSSIPRHERFISLLVKCGCPGSTVTAPLIPVTHDDPNLEDLHPLLIPIVRTKDTVPKYICALLSPHNKYSTSSDPPTLPIVETYPHSPGLKLLSLNSEHLLRRIAATADINSDSEAVDLYNDDLGSGTTLPPNLTSLDCTYSPSDVAGLGYGLDKYLLLRVGPFPDVYEKVS